MPEQINHGGRGVRNDIRLAVADIVAKALAYNGVPSELEGIIVRTGLTGGGVAASGVLTSNNTNVSDGNTVTIGTQTYTFKTALTGPTTPNQVLIGAAADDSLTNLAAAINGEAGSGTTYGSLTPVNGNVSASTVSAHAITVTAKQSGVAANSIATTKVGATLSWGAATLAGGIATITITFGIVTDGVAPANSTTLGTVTLANANTSAIMAAVARPLNVLAKGTWICIKSVSGNAGSLDMITIHILRKRFSGIL